MNRARSPIAAALFLAIAFAAGAALAAGEEPAGRVKNVEGAAFLVRDGVRAPAAAGDAVYQNDTLETGSDGSMGVTFRDESRLALGPDTSLVVDEYVFQPEGEKSFVSRLVRGTVLGVSGLIAKLSPGSSKMETPDGTIGFRGTRYLVKLVPRGGA